MKNKALVVLLASLILLFFQYCAEVPSSHNAIISPPLPRSEINNENATLCKVDLNNSRLRWVGTKPTGQHFGTLGLSDGELWMVNNQIEGGDFTIDIHDIEVEELEGKQKQKFITHLMSPDFFDAENHPVARFEITSVSKYIKDSLFEGSMEGNPYIIPNPSHKISGNLTLRGTTLNVTFPALITMDKGELLVKAKFNLDRTKWGVSYWEESTLENRAKDKLIFNKVNIRLRLEATY